MSGRKGSKRQQRLSALQSQVELLQNANDKSHHLVNYDYEEYSSPGGATVLDVLSDAGGSRASSKSGGYHSHHSSHSGYGSHHSGYGHHESSSVKECCELVVDPLTFAGLLGMIGLGTVFLNTAITMNIMGKKKRKRRSSSIWLDPIQEALRPKLADTLLKGTRKWSLRNSSIGKERFK